MSQIIKSFTGIVMVMFLMMTGSGVLSAFLQTMHAQNLHASMIDELENSHYAKSVIEECFAVLEHTSYELEICLYSETQATTACRSIADIPANMDNISLAEVVLRYPVQIVFWDLDMKQEIFGYAR